MDYILYFITIGTFDFNRSWLALVLCIDFLVDHCWIDEWLMAIQ